RPLSGWTYISSPRAWTRKASIFPFNKICWWVSGARKVPVNDEADYYRQERFDRDSRRVIPLPDDVDRNGSTRTTAMGGKRIYAPQMGFTVDSWGQTPWNPSRA